MVAVSCISNISSANRSNSEGRPHRPPLSIRSNLDRKYEFENGFERVFSIKTPAMEGQGVQRSGWYKQVVNFSRAVVSEGLREGDRLEIMNFQQQHNNRGAVRWDGSGSAPDLVTMSNATRNALLFVHKIEREQPGRIRSSKEVVNELREEGIKYETDSVQKCLSELAEDGLLNKAQVDTNDDRREPTPGALPHEFSTTEQGREAIARFTLWFIEIAGISAPDIWELDDALDAYAHEGAFRSEEGTGRHDLLRQIIRNFEGGGR